MVLAAVLLLKHLNLGVYDFLILLTIPEEVRMIFETLLHFLDVRLIN